MMTGRRSWITTIQLPTFPFGIFLHIKHLRYFSVLSFGTAQNIHKTSTRWIMNLKSGTQWYKKSFLSLQTPPNDDNKNPVSAADQCMKPFSCSDLRCNENPTFLTAWFVTGTLQHWPKHRLDTIFWTHCQLHINFTLHLLAIVLCSLDLHPQSQSL